MATLRIEAELGPRAVWPGLLSLALTALAQPLSSENVTLNTFYPAPSGVYAQMLTTGQTWLARDNGNVGVGLPAPSNKLQVQGLGGGTVDLAVNGQIMTGDASGVGGVWVDSGKTMRVGQTGSSVGFWGVGAGWGLTMDRGTGRVTVNGGGLTDADGTQGPGKVLTSDASGNATWQSPAGTGGMYTVGNHGSRCDYANPMTGAC